MNWQHLWAFVWLRWRLLINQSRRDGAFNGVLMMIVIVGAAVTAIPLFFATIGVGVYLIPKATPLQIMYALDAMIAAFLLFWGIGLVTELQRTEPLTLSKFMHLPVSVNSAFLINYLSSLLRLSLIVFGPVLLGFCVALVIAKGPMLLVGLPLLAAFFLMVTALTYQLQGWLASMMSNPRRRRTVVLVTTTAFILLAQLPNLLNFFAAGSPRDQANRSTALVNEMKKLERAFQAKEFDAMEHLRRQQKLMQDYQLAQKQAGDESARHWERTARLLNVALPVGWLPMGVMYAAAGTVLPSLPALLAMALIGTASLWRAYYTTIGIYQGRFTSQKGRPAPASAPGGTRRPGILSLDARLPGLTEPVSAVALAGLRSLLRSPETKMTLLTPIIMSGIVGSMLWNQRHSIPETFRPLVAFGAMVQVLLGVLQQLGNQFGFDRDGFRVFVLCSAPRRDILLGKNLSFLPLALGMGAILLLILQIVCPMSLEHFFGMIPQYVSMFLLCCMFTNLLSIYAPVHVPAGSLKPSNMKLTTALVQIAMFLVLFPLTQGVTLLPLGIEMMLRLVGWGSGVPVFFLLSLLEFAAVVLLYHLALNWQGALYQSREQRILDVVTNRAS